MDTATDRRLLVALQEENRGLRRENNALKTDIGYWKRCHRDAVAREEALKGQLRDRDARIKYLSRQLYERKSEASKRKPESDEPTGTTSKRKRGQQRGRPIPARRDQSHLPVYEEVHDIEDSERFCPSCGLPVKPMPDTEDSTVIETLQVRGYRRKIRRKKYKRSCRCAGMKGIITAAGPPKLMPHSRYGASVWIHILIRKYRMQIPVQRIREESELAWAVDPERQRRRRTEAACAAVRPDLRSAW